MLVVTPRSVVMKAARVACLLLLTAHCSLLTASAQYAQPPRGGLSGNAPPPVFKGVGIEQRLGSQLPLDAVFRDETGREVKLGDYFGRRPVLIAPVYFSCPMLCTQVLDGVSRGLKGLQFDAGREFDVLAVSFDPRDRAEDAAAKKRLVLDNYGRAETAAGWHFLTGEQGSIDALMGALGFGYRFVETTGQFAHASGLMVATPEGKVSHYFYGIEYAPRDLKLGFVEASAGRVGSPVDKLVLYCFHYDPESGKYGLAVLNTVRAAGVVTLVGLVTLILILRRGRPTRAGADEAPAAGGAV